MVVDAPEHGRDRREQVRVPGGDVPGAPAAHRVARQVDPVVVHAEETLRLGDRVQDVAVPHAQVLRVPAAVGLEVDDALVVLELGVDARVAFGCAPPAHVDRVRGVVAVKLHDERPLPAGLVARRQIGPAELRRAVHVVAVRQAHEAVGTDASGLALPLQHQLLVLHQRSVDLRPGVAPGRAQLAAQAVLDHVDEHPEGEALGLQGVRGRGRGGELARLGKAVALVPGQVGRVEETGGPRRAAAHLVGTVRPGVGVDRQLRAARGRGREDRLAAGANHLDRDRIGVLPFRADVGHEREAVRPQLDERRADLGPSSQHGAGLEHPRVERAVGESLDQQGVLTGVHLHGHAVLVGSRGAQAVAGEHRLAVQPHADAVAAADREQGRAGLLPGHLREGVGDVARPGAGQIAERHVVAPGLLRVPADARPVGALHLLAVGRLSGGFATLPAQAVGPQRAGERSGDEPLPKKVTVAALPRHPQLVLQLGLRSRRRLLAQGARNGEGCRQGGSRCVSDEVHVLPFPV